MLPAATPWGSDCWVNRRLCRLSVLSQLRPQRSDDWFHQPVDLLLISVVSLLFSPVGCLACDCVEKVGELRRALSSELGDRLRDLDVVRAVVKAPRETFGQNTDSRAQTFATCSSTLFRSSLLGNRIPRRAKNSDEQGAPECRPRRREETAGNQYDYACGEDSLDGIAERHEAALFVKSSSDLPIRKADGRGRFPSNGAVLSTARA